MTMEAARFRKRPAQCGVSHGTKRLRPLLIQLLDENQLHGLEWINKEKGIWQLPWKTKKKSLLHEPDGKVLQAIARVMWPDEGSLSKWKERLRNDLRSLEDIEMIEADKTKLFKIYKFLEEKPKRGKKPVPPPTSTQSGFTDDNATATASLTTPGGPYDDFRGRPQVLFPDINGHFNDQFDVLSCRPLPCNFTEDPVSQGYRSRSPIQGGVDLPSENLEVDFLENSFWNLTPDSDDQSMLTDSQGPSDLSILSSELFTPEAGFDEGRFGNLPDFQGLLAAEQNNSPDENVVPNESKAENDTFTTGTLNSGVAQNEISHNVLLATENSVAVNNTCVVDRSVSSADHGSQSSLLPVVPRPVYSLSVPPVQPNENEQPLLTVKVYYFRYLVLQKPVQKSSFTLCYGFTEHHSSEIQRIELRTSELCRELTQKQMEVINDVLGTLKRGVLFSVRNKNIYATRKCKARVVSQVLPKNPSGQILKRHSEIQIFEYETGFVPLLERSLRSSSGNAKMPECVVRLSLGGESGIIDDRPGIITVNICHELASQQLKFEEDNRFPSNAPECSKSDSYDDVVNSLQNLMTGEDGEGDE
ncbi:uncharacterized protein LOC101863854 [Aplysia californica]|uniref:Uncharacterized protein LOC101863854 n=1 Tax=Aplysia californica TaxID=6500 RepID=A0ABM0K7C2_APLCA|nr:uncharacterized protein LOC101863854 [Aplysia californica]